jgi:hypothetical protein
MVLHKVKDPKLETDFQTFVNKVRMRVPLCHLQPHGNPETRHASRKSVVSYRWRDSSAERGADRSRAKREKCPQPQELEYLFSH